MNSIPRPHLYPNRWLLDSALAPHIDAYVAHLNRGRYSLALPVGILLASRTLRGG